MQEPVCDMRLDAVATFARRDTAKMLARLKACDQALRTHTAERATDIRGALYYAALTLHGDQKIVRGILLATDLEESLERGQIGATPNLHGICVAVFSMVTPHSVVRPDSLDLRESQWRARLSKWGAARVRVESILGFDAADIESFFQNCPPSRSP
jgi:hypothetical protein